MTVEPKADSMDDWLVDLWASWKVVWMVAMLVNEKVVLKAGR